MRKNLLLFKLLGTAVLLYTLLLSGAIFIGVLALAAPIGFAFSSIKWALFGLVGLVCALVVAIWKVWSQPRPTQFVVLMVVCAGGLAFYASLSSAYRKVVFQDYASPFSEPVEAIELVSVGHTNRTPAIFGLHVAFKYGFNEVQIGDQVYRKIGAGLYSREALDSTRRARFVVTERIRHAPKESESWNPRRGDVEIVIQDRNSGTEIGKWFGPEFNDGWENEQAGNFVRNILPQSSQVPPTRFSTIKPTFSELPVNQILMPEETDARLRNCNDDYKLVRWGSPSGSTELQTPDWIVGFARGPAEVFCSEAGVLLFEGDRDRLRMDWLGDDGELRAQIDARLPNELRRLKVLTAKTVSAKLADGHLQVHRAYFNFPAPFVSPVSAVYEVTAIIPASMESSAPANGAGAGVQEVQHPEIDAADL